nr:30S ribosomal protein S8 [Candidatus Woesearchaeota archaeon]
MDNLNNALSKMMNAERIGRDKCIILVSSKITKDVLIIMKNNGYIGDFKEIKDGKGGKIIVNLIGKINNVGVIKPRFSVKMNQYEKYEKRFMPAKDFGFIVVSTSNGMMTHIEAKEKNLGGRLISFVY